MLRELTEHPTMACGSGAASITMAPLSYMPGTHTMVINTRSPPNFLKYLHDKAGYLINMAGCMSFCIDLY